MRDKWSFCVTPHAYLRYTEFICDPKLAQNLTTTTATTLRDSVGKLTADENSGTVFVVLTVVVVIVCAWCAK